MECSHAGDLGAALLRDKEARHLASDSDWLRVDLGALTLCMGHPGPKQRVAGICSKKPSVPSKNRSATGIHTNCIFIYKRDFCASGFVLHVLLALTHIILTEAL